MTVEPPIRRRLPRSRRAQHTLRAAALLTVVATLTLAASAAAGLEPGLPAPLLDAAFRPVVVPSPAAVTAPDPVPFASPDLTPLRDAKPAAAPPERPQPSVAAPKRIVVVTPTAPPPRPRTSHAISGAASWYCRAGWSPCTVSHPDVGGVQAYAAAGPRLRAALGDWRGRIVYVDGVRVKLIDWCQCYRGEPNEKLLDLYYDVFKQTGSPVTIRW